MDAIKWIPSRVTETLARLSRFWVIGCCRAFYLPQLSSHILGGSFCITLLKCRRLATINTYRG